MPKFNTVRRGFNTIGGLISGSVKEAEYVGAVMAFANATAPTGWKRVIDYDDMSIRITNSTVTSTLNGFPHSAIFYGTYPIFGPSPVTISGSSGAHTTTVSEMSPHTHPVTQQPYPTNLFPSGAMTVVGSAQYAPGLPVTVGAAPNPAFPVYSPNPASPIVGGSHSHSVSAVNVDITNSTPVNFNVKYLDVILCKY